MATKLVQKAKYSLLKCFLITKEEKQTISKELLNWSEGQLMQLIDTIKEYEKRAEPLVKAGFKTEKGREFFREIENIYPKMKRSTYKQIEKEEDDSTQADVDLPEDLKNI